MSLVDIFNICRWSDIVMIRAFLKLLRAPNNPLGQMIAAFHWNFQPFSDAEVDIIISVFGGGVVGRGAVANHLCCGDCWIVLWVVHTS